MDAGQICREPSPTHVGIARERSPASSNDFQRRLRGTSALFECFGELVHQRFQKIRQSASRAGFDLDLGRHAGNEDMISELCEFGIRDFDAREKVRGARLRFACQIGRNRCDVALNLWASCVGRKQSAEPSQLHPFAPPRYLAA